MDLSNMDADSINEQIEEGLEKVEHQLSVNNDEEGMEIVEDVREHKDNGEYMKCVQKLRELENRLKEED